MVVRSRLDPGALIRHKTKPDNPMPKYLTILFGAALLVSDLQAQPEYVTTQSLSKQFMVYGPKTAPMKRSSRIPLDPALLAVSCERIKQGVLTELGGIERAQLNFRNENVGKIYVVLHSGADKRFVITPIKNPGAFSYRVDLPNEIEAEDLIEAITQATLLEMVNRRSAETITELPLWLSHGISARVRSAALGALVLEQHLSIDRDKATVDPAMWNLFYGPKRQIPRQYKVDALAKIRQDLQNFSPLTFEELSWPENLSKERAGRFDACAELFVHELFRLKRGQDCLRQMLEELPNHLNWQVAFKHAFQPHFKELVDVEKWWGLRLVNLIGFAQIESREQSIEEIDATLRVPSEVRFSADEVPSRRDLTLQELVSGSGVVDQKAALSKVVTRLRALRMRVQPELGELIEDYRATLETYLQSDEKNGLLQRIFTRDHADESKHSALVRLNALDEKRGLFRKKANPITREEAMRSALEIAAQRSASTSIKQ